jgi:hypothetical protein
MAIAVNSVHTPFSDVYAAEKIKGFKLPLANS